MHIIAEKLRLIEWLARLNDADILREFIRLKNEKEKDWWDELSEEERAEIEEGLAQAERGDVIPHDEVMNKYRKWL